MLTLELSAENPLTLQRQIVEQIRAQILQGTLSAGVRLPPSRQMAAQHQVSRITVKAAYEQLAAEGFVASRQGSGTFVANIPEVMIDQTQPASVPLSNWAQRAVTTQTASTRSKKVEIDFGFGRSFPHLFPYDTWRKLLARYLSTDDAILSRYGSPAGFAPLREALADYLGRARGVNCSAEQVVIVNGMQQAVDIVARLLLNAGDEVLVESPGYTEAYKLLQVYGAKLVGLPVDEAGFPVDQIPEDSKARLVFVTPANQFPRGGRLSLERRLRLLQWAQQHQALILEDDYDSELRYDGRKIGALQGLDSSGHVIYLGTFSKILFPALRLAYVVLPQQLIQPFLAAKRLIDRGSPTLTQAAITDFLAEGHFDKHVRRLRTTYEARRTRLVNALDRYLPQLTHSSFAAGLHVMVDLPSHVDEAQFVRQAEAVGVGVYPAAPYYIGADAQPGILLSFSEIADEKIEAGIGRIATLLNSDLFSKAA